MVVKDSGVVNTAGVCDWWRCEDDCQDGGKMGDESKRGGEGGSEWVSGKQAVR